jgi:dTDP-4-dehydrorhamnose reductase
MRLDSQVSYRAAPWGPQRHSGRSRSPKKNRARIRRRRPSSLAGERSNCVGFDYHHVVPHRSDPRDGCFEYMKTGSLRVALVGARGLVGSALIKSTPAHVTLKAYSHHDLDVTNKRCVLDCITAEIPHVIINAAVYLAADAAECDAESAIAVNAHGPRHLAHAARITRARLVQLSTAYVFDGASSVPYRPDSETNPVSTYGRTKLEGERAVLDVLPESAIVLRSSWIYGAGRRNPLTSMLHRFRSGTPMTAIVDQIGTPTSATSFAEAVWKVIAMADVTGIHHWTAAGVASWYDFAVALAEEALHLGIVAGGTEIMPIMAADYQRVAVRPRFSVLDTTSLTLRGLTTVHWRKELRRTLREVQSRSELFEASNPVAAASKMPGHVRN